MHKPVFPNPLLRGLPINSGRAPHWQGLHPWLVSAAPPGLLPEDPTDYKSEPRTGRHSRARGEAPGDFGGPSETSLQQEGAERQTRQIINLWSVACLVCCLFLMASR